MHRRWFLTQCAAAPIFASPFFHGATRANDVSWLAEVQRRPVTIPVGAAALTSVLDDVNSGGIKTRDAWKKKRQQLSDWWRSFLGELKRDPDAPPAYEVVAAEEKAGVLRKLIRYETEPGQLTEAYVLSPADLKTARAGFVVFHSTVPHSIRQPAGVEGKQEKAFGWRLARRGHIAICPRNYLWPTNHRIEAKSEAEKFSARRPECKGMARMLLDALVAVDLLSQWPGVDANKLGAVGHSLGAKEVLYLAAFDERVKASVSSEGGIGTTFSNWNAEWYLGKAIQDKAFTHEHHELLAMVAPRAFLLIGGGAADGAQSWPFIEAALPAYRLFPGAPKLGLYHHDKGHNVPPEAGPKILEWLETYTGV